MGTKVPVYEISDYIIRGIEGSTNYICNGEKKFANIFKFSPLRLSFVHIDNQLNTKFESINPAIILVFLFGTLLTIFLLTGKVDKIKKSIDDSEKYASNYEFDSRRVDKDKLKQISEELKGTISKLDNLS